MAFHSAQLARIYIGMVPASAYARSASVSAQTDVHDVTTLIDSSKQFITGHNMSSWQFAGPLDGDASQNGQYDALSDIVTAGVAVPITYLPHGDNPQVWMAEAIDESFDLQVGVQGTSDWAMNFRTTGVTDLLGRILENNTTITADTNGTSLDNGAGTSGGGVAQLHVTAYSGFTSDAIKIQHSTDNSSWNDLVSFTLASGRTAERVTVAGTVNRYLRVVDDVTGSGSITRLVSFCRR